MAEAVLAGLVAGYGIAIPVGAIAILIIHTAIGEGFRRGFAAGAGAATADLLYAALAVVLGVAAADLVTPLQTPLKLIAGVVLIGLAVLGLARLRSPREPGDPARTLAAHRSDRRTYLTFVGLTMLNPVTVVYFGALVMALPFLEGVAERAAFVSAVFVASLSWQSLLASVGAALGRGPGHRLRVPSIVVGNLVILALAVTILADAAGISLLP
jgi:threonine/homoserine/homoserine lactone efflux protein